MAIKQTTSKSSAKERKLVFVGMSGGVDSSVAAHLLKLEGYDVVGVHLRCWNVDGCDIREAEDARRVANKLEIPFYVLDMEEQYRERVVEYMIEGYKNGITPNPDVACNKEIKFGLFLDEALKMGADYIATGHYVRLSEQGGTYKLFEAKDKNKDQSYFLWTLTQEQLQHCLFPIGDYLKSEVRDIAKEAGLPTADKKDSQGICFIGKVTIADFLARYIPEDKGAVVTIGGDRLGEHNGAQFYTIGQRHLGVNLKFPSRDVQTNTSPVYVVDKNVTTNTVTVAEGDNNPALYKSELTISNLNLIRGDLPSGLVMARVRYRQKLSPAKFVSLSDKGIKLSFEHPQKFVAPGQSAVFYSEEGEMIGGGVIV